MEVSTIFLFADTAFLLGGADIVLCIITFDSYRKAGLVWPNIHVFIEDFKFKELHLARPTQTQAQSKEEFLGYKTCRGEKLYSPVVIKVIFPYFVWRVNTQQ